MIECRLTDTEKRHALSLALNFNFQNHKQFEVYRRKDNRTFRFCRYDGKNYDALYEYLQNRQGTIDIWPQSKLVPGTLYVINGNGVLQTIPDANMRFVVAANNYLVRGSFGNNLLFNFELAKYLLEHYKGIKLRISTEVNMGNSKEYTDPEQLDAIPADSYYRTHKVWFMLEKTRQFILEEIPEPIIATYLDAPDFYQEFETFEKDGLLGILAYKMVEKVPAIYQDIKIENYRAYLKNAEGLWAEYNLKSSQFITEFLYKDITYDASKGYVVATDGEKEIVLHSPAAKEQNQIVKDSSGYYGVKAGDEWVIRPEYDWVSLWKDSPHYEVFKDGCYGLMDAQGNVILSCRYGAIDATASDVMLFKAAVDDRWGVVGYGDTVWGDFTIEEDDLEGLEALYTDCGNRYINDVFASGGQLNLQLIALNPSKELIVVRVADCDRSYSFRKQYLTDTVYDLCMSGYFQAVQCVKRLSLRIAPNGTLRVHPKRVLNWLQLQQKLSELQRGVVYPSVVVQVTDTYLSVQLENGVQGRIYVEDSGRSVGQAVDVLLRYVSDTHVVFKYAEETAS